MFFGQLTVISDSACDFLFYHLYYYDGYHGNCWQIGRDQKDCILKKLKHRAIDPKSHLKESIPVLLVPGPSLKHMHLPS